MDGEKQSFYGKVQRSSNTNGRIAAIQDDVICYEITTYSYLVTCIRGNCSEPVLKEVTVTIVCEINPTMTPADPNENGGGDGETCFVPHPVIEELMVPCDAGIWPDDVILNEPESNSEDPKTYFKCFNLSAGATVTIYIDQPKSNSRDTWTDNDPSLLGIDPDVGHTFVSIQQGNITRVFGFYPKNGVNPFMSPSDSSAFVNDSGHDFDVSITIPVNASQLSNIVQFSQNYQTYDLNTNNCTDFGIAIAQRAGITLIDTNGSWPGGGGSNPGDLGQDVRAMSSNQNRTINKVGGVSLNNSGSCN